MAETSQFENEAFLELLTEALRAGPGSPAWHQALGRLRASELSEAEEYRLLMEAREHLESGREYRSIRPGPNFTRKVMEAVDEAAGSRPALPSANLIALLAGLAILAVVVLVGVILLKDDGLAGSIAELEGSYFSKTLAGGDFAQGIPAEWKTFGLEPVLVANKGLRGGLPKESEKDYQSGGICLASPIAAENSFALEATVRMARATNHVDLQFFVTDAPAFADSTTSSSPGLVVDLRDGQWSVFMVKQDVTAVGEAMKVGEGGNIPLLIKVDRQFVIVESEGKRLYAGTHGLPQDKPRYPGIKFLTRGGEKGLEEVTVQSVRVLRP